MFTKTQIEIMKVFVSKIDSKFSIKEIAEKIKKPYPLVHRSIKLLIKNKFIEKDDKNLLSLNYKSNEGGIAYIEFLRKTEFLKKDKTIHLFYKDIKNNIGLDFFIFIVFGSSVERNNFRDIDVLFIIEDKKKISTAERIIENIASNFNKSIDINVISIESAYEMLMKRNKINIMNETLNKHIILFGAENYYNILQNVR